jgi:hypothetical protein
LTIAVLAAGAPALSPASVRAQNADFWSFLEAGRIIARCPESSAAHAAAETQLAQLDQRIDALGDADSPAAAIRGLHDLLKTECFLPAVEALRLPEPDTALSLKEWWTTGGGRNWLASFLDAPLMGRAEHLLPHVVVPADARTTLDLDSHRSHPLRPLLCGLRDVACGADTSGWSMRADAAFEAARLADSKGRVTRRDDDESDADAVARACAGQISSSEAGRGYGLWRACIEKARPRRVALPLGRFKAPRTGWVIITGRRGHYSFCHTARAYDLATGAAYIHDTCANLALKVGGHVDAEATNAALVARIETGTLPVDNLREAVWMMLLRGQAEKRQLRPEYYPIPAGLIPQATVPTDQDEVGTGGFWMHTGQTSLTWRWVRPGSPAMVGTVTWPNSYDAAENHAASLLDIAEQGLVRRCLDERVPDALAFTSAADRHLDEVEPDDLREHEREAMRAIGKWRALPACRPRRPGPRPGR